MREERGELLAAQVDIPSDDTPREEKECESADSTTKALAEYAILVILHQVIKNFKIYFISRCARLRTCYLVCSIF